MPPIDPNIPQLNGWNEYKRLVLHELERLDGNIVKLADKQDETIEMVRVELQRTRDSLHEALTTLGTKIAARQDKDIVTLRKELEETRDEFQDEFDSMKLGLHKNTAAISSIKAAAAAWGAAAGIVIGVVTALVTWFAR